MITRAANLICGAFNAVSPVGHTTTGELLETVREVTGSTAELVCHGRTPDVPGPINEPLAWPNATVASGDAVDVVTLFPVITGRTGVEPILQGAADFDLDLVESRTLDGHTKELIYRPTLH